MADLKGIDGEEQPIEIAADGTGAPGDPFILKRKIVDSVLPAGAATAANQATQSGYLDGLEAALASLLTAIADLATGVETQPVSLASNPLPTGAATAAHQVTQSGYLDGVETALASIDTQLAAKANLVDTQPVSLAASPLPSGAATAAHQATQNGYLDGIEAGLASLLTESQAKADLTETQPVSAASLPLPAGAATAAHQVTQNGYLDGVEALLTTLDGRVDALEASIGATNETVAAGDTSTAGLNALIKRALQHLTTTFGRLPAALAAGGGLKIEGVPGGVAVPISGSISASSSPPVKHSATPTISTSIYADADVVGGLMTFSGVPVAGTIVGFNLQDKDAEQAPLELWLFDASITPAADQAPHSISDADMANCIGVIPNGTYYASALNAVAFYPMPGIAYDLDSGTSIFGLLVSRGTPTFGSTSDLTVELLIQA